MLVQQGDRKALTRLHQRWNPRLHRAALRYTGDPDLAWDVTQESWLGIWKGIRRLSHPSKFRAFVFTVVHRKGADYLRRAIRTRTATQEQAVDQQESNASQEDRMAIQQAFAALPPDQRLAAHLFFVEGLTLREIAEVQDIAEGTAKSRLFHARQKLKAGLTEQHEFTQGDPS